MKISTDMDQDAQNKKDGTARRTVSLDPELDAFAMRRMAEGGFTKFSHYIQDLVRKDTADLRKVTLGGFSSEATPSTSKGATAPHVRSSSASLKQNRTK